ncbi:MAG: hypothetical protein ACT4OE_04695 [Sphingosinicella sp.]
MTEPAIGYFVGMDASDTLVRNAGGPMLFDGISDIHRLRVHQPRSYCRLHVTPSYFRQRRRFR